ncbi:MAG: peptide deformylase [Candidatus Aureabacteria bacterium]|nr:peptide deformylase [Candidatus Auribacterota bacterium]
MAIMNIRTIPDEILRKVCEPVKEIGRQEKKLFDDMVETMIQKGGVGLAASQVGESCQIFVVGLENEFYKIANPKIVEFFGTEVMQEGCLSVPEVVRDMERFYGVIIKGLNENGEQVEMKATGFLARIFQHEIDHLNGKLIIDYSSQFFRPGNENEERLL